MLPRLVPEILILYPFCDVGVGVVVVGVGIGDSRSWMYMNSYLYSFSHFQLLLLSILLVQAGAADQTLSRAATPHFFLSLTSLFQIISFKTN